MRSGRNSQFGLRILATGLVAAAVMSACSSSSDDGGGGGGGAIQSPAQLNTTLTSVVGALNTGALAGLGSLNSAGSVLAGLTAHGGGGANLKMMIAARPSRQVLVDRGNPFHLRIPPRAERVAGGARVAFGTRQSQSLIDPGNYTKSYVYDDVETLSYIDDGTNAGPANGAQLALYEVDASGQIVSPLNQTGVLILEDESTATEDVVRVIVKDLTGTEQANYTVTINAFDGASGTYEISSGGTITDAGTVYTFTYHESFDGTTGDYNNDVTLSTEGASLEQHWAISYDPDTQEGTLSLDITLTVGDQVVRLAGTEQQSGAYLFNVYTQGGLYATANSTVGDGTFLNTSGQPLTADEETLLETLVEVAVEINNDIYDLVFFTLLIVA